MPRKLDAQFIARYSMSSVLSTSTMKSPPLELWFTGSLSGALVSTAICRGPGGSALRSARGAHERRPFEEIAAAGIRRVTALGHGIPPVGGADFDTGAFSAYVANCRAA